MSTINTLSTLQKSLNSRTSIANQDREVDRARQELVTGLKNDVYADKSFRSAQALDMRNRMDRTEAYLTSNRLLEGKLDVTANRLMTIRSEMQEFQVLGLSLTSGTQSHNILQEQARAALAGLASQLNTVYGGEYLFSGQNAMAESLTMPSTGIAAARLPSNASAADVANQIASLNAYFALEGATPTTPSFSDEAYGGSHKLASAGLDETTSYDYGMTADDEAIRNVIKGLTMFAEMDVSEISDPAAFSAWTSAATHALTKGIQGITDREVQLGNQQALLARTIERQDSLMAIYNNRVMDIEGVDQYEVATRLESLSAQLEASYAVTVRLKNLSLLNFM